ncbi:GSCOCG00011698001-RA-CDS [Cotesia congregata]|nr:GSCOCG00011698001-RA-CDS [Cotesia congregata]
MRVVFTCGLCETICDEYVSHECLRNYNDVHIDENYYFFSLLDDKVTILRRALLPNGTEGVIHEKLYPTNDENQCPNTGEVYLYSNASISKKQNNTGSTAKRSKKLNDDEVEILLLEVQSRPPLWNFELPLVQRSKEIVTALWQEVSRALNGQLTADGARKKFKSLRDTHRKLIGDEHHGSGSGRVEQREKLKFYKSCEFLRDSCLIRPTRSNMPDNVDVGEHDDHRNTSMNDSESAADNISTHRKSRKRNRESEETDTLDSLSRIADKICNESIKPALPTPPSIDVIDNFMIGIGHQIRKLPEEFHFEVMIEIMNLVHNIEKQYSAC